MSTTVRHDPTFASALAGFLVVACLVAWRDRAAAERARGRELVPTRGELDDASRPRDDSARIGAEPAIERWSARELRALPGLGERRAVAIVRARWAGEITGALAGLDDLHGIGPETVNAIRAELVPRRRVPAGARPAHVTRAGPGERP